VSSISVENRPSRQTAARSSVAALNQRLGVEGAGPGSGWRFLRRRPVRPRLTPQWRPREHSRPGGLCRGKPYALAWRALRTGLQWPVRTAEDVRVRRGTGDIGRVHRVPLPARAETSQVVSPPRSAGQKPPDLAGPESAAPVQIDRISEISWHDS
jgi:hypothetical protein